jgi:cytoskeletal protein RodZ
MVSKDQSIGGLIFIVCVVVGILYTAGLFYWGTSLGNPNESAWSIEFWLIALPVFIAFVAIMGIGAWIGWTMATTPPPKPIEEITTEIEEKKEEAPPPPPEPKEEAKPAEETPKEPAEEKKPERKRRT